MLEMILKIDGTVGNFPTLKEFRESGEGLTVGGFCFRVQVNGKMLDVNFDFPAYAANVLSDNTLMFEAGAATFFSNHNDHLDECYDEEYAKMGISRADLTGEVLSSATEIREVAIDCDYSIHLKILDITFIEDGKSYHVGRLISLKSSIWNINAITDFQKFLPLRDFVNPLDMEMSWISQAACGRSKRAFPCMSRLWKPT